MAIKITESVTITANVEIENAVAVHLLANIVSDGSEPTTQSKNILNKDLYDANRVKCREGIAEFQAYVYEVEDRLSALEGDA